VKQRHFIDSHKAVTGLFVLTLIALYGRWPNTTAWVYLALHGTYGLLWVLKSRLFGDKSWDRPASLRWGVLVAWGGLTVYWVAPWLLISRNVQAPAWYLALCIALYAVGVFLHFASDMQKHMWLKLRPGELLTTGLWTRVRNPNYLGELLIYLSFALLALHWIPLVLLALFVAAYWAPNMVRKDRSLSRYPEFAAYRTRTKLFIPGIL
jgi:protein-S-isoprenylcysteine O-methyltransferase Ste14